MAGGEYTGRHYVAVTPNDSTSLMLASGELPIAFSVGTAGNLALKAAPGATAVTFKNRAAGTEIAVSATYVMSTNTTAADIVAIYERP